MRRKTSFRKGSRGGQLKSWTLTESEILLLRLYDLTEEYPKLGPSKALASLLIGNIEQSFDPEKGDFTFQRNRRVVALTPYNLALHFGFFQKAMMFFQTAMEVGTTPPDEVLRGTKEFLLNQFNKQIATPVRRYLAEVGWEGVRCYYYVCPTIETHANPETGDIGFKLGTDWPLTVIPYSLERARKKWGLDDELVVELALTAGWLIYNKLIAYRLIFSLEQAEEMIGDWRQALPAGVLPYLQDVVGKNALLTPGAQNGEQF